ncbi:hypothetical protein [Nocardia sp. MDA0666]
MFPRSAANTWKTTICTYGYPTSDPAPDPESGSVVQQFEHGSI